jgi:hypothetical protein
VNSNAIFRFWVIPIISFSLGLALILGHTEWAMGDDCPVHALTKHAVSIPRQEVKTFLSFLKTAKHAAIGKNEDCREKILFLAMEFNLEMIDQYEDNHDAEFEKSHFSEYREMQQEIREAGWIITKTDGVFEIEADDAWILEQLKEVLPKVWQNYLAELENEHSALKDHKIIISWEALGERLSVWYEFSLAHPQFSAKEEVQDRLVQYARLYFLGAGEDGPSPIPVSAYETFLKNHPQSRLNTVISWYLEEITKNQNKITPAMRDSLARKLAEIELK